MTVGKALTLFFYYFFFFLERGCLIKNKKKNKNDQVHSFFFFLNEMASSFRHWITISTHGGHHGINENE